MWTFDVENFQVVRVFYILYIEMVQLPQTGAIDNLIEIFTQKCFLVVTVKNFN